MPISSIIPWDNPWTTPVLDSDLPDRAFLSTGEGDVIPNGFEVVTGWYIGYFISSIEVTITCTSARTIQLLLYEDDGGGAVLIGGDTFVVSAGSPTLTLPVVGQTTDISLLQILFGSALSPGESLDNIVVFGGSPPVSDFWTSFTKSYEIP